jgi:hypothetical protein
VTKLSECFKTQSYETILILPKSYQLSMKLPQIDELECDGPENMSIYYLQGIMNTIGPEQTKKLLAEIAGQIEGNHHPSLGCEGVLRAVKRESNLERSKKWRGGGPKNKVQRCVQAYLLAGENLLFQSTTYSEARINLSRTSFWRFRQAIKKETGREPVCEIIWVPKKLKEE